MSKAKMKKFSRKLTAILLTMAIIVLQLPSGIFAVTVAEDEDLPTASETITLGASVPVTKRTIFAFTPEESGVYCIYSSNRGESDPVLNLYDANNKMLGSDDDGGGNLNFEFNYNFTAGETYYIEASSYGEVCQYTLSIKESDILSIEYVSGGEYEFIENDLSSGYWRTVYEKNIVDRFFNYNSHRLLEDIVIKVNYKDGSSEKISYYNEFDGWSGISWDWDFFKNPWSVGSDNQVNITYKGLSFTMNVTVIESPIKSLEIVSASDFEFIEHDSARGYWSKYYEELEVEEYFEYDYYAISEDLVLLATYKDGRTETLSAKESGEDWYQVGYYSNQYLEPWTIGGKNELEIGYKGATITYNAKIKKNTVKSISLASGGKFAYTEFDEEYGYWAGSDNGEQYFYYYPYQVLSDVVLNVTHEDGTVEQIEAANNPSVLTSNTQHEKPWTAGGENLLEIKYMGAGLTIPVTIKPGLVESFTVADIVVTEGTNGSFWTHTDGDEFSLIYHYEVFFNDITVNLSDGRVLKGDESYIEEELGANISYFADQGFENPWGVGSHEVTATLMGKKATFNYIIEESGVESISIADVTMTEYESGYYSDGYWNDMGEYVEENWFRYSIPSTPITITFTDGTSITGTQQDIEEQTDIYIDMFTNQDYDRQWGVGTHTAIAYCSGSMCKFSVNITESNVKSLEVIDDGDFFFYENDESRGYWEDNYFHYGTDYLMDNLTFRITYKDGTTKDVKYYDQLDNNAGITYYDNQNKNPWTVGGENIITFNYMGATVNYSVAVKGSPIKSLEVIDTEDFFFYENDITYGNWEEDFFYYSVWDLACHTTLRVTYNDGTTEDIGFFNENGDGNTFSYLVDQWSNPWTVGGENIITFTYLGAQVDFSATVKETPIEFIEVEPVTITKGTNGSWNYSEIEIDGEYVVQKYFIYNVNPEKITVYFKDGTKAEGTPDEIREITGSYPHSDSTQDYYNQWDIGSHTATLSLMGYNTEYSVNITDSPILSVEVDPLSYMQGTNGEWYTHCYEVDGESVEERYYLYNSTPENITVTYKDGTVIKGTPDEIYEQTGVYPDYYTEQDFYNQWGVGEHTATLEFMGISTQYVIEITPSPVLSIEIEPLSIIEGTNGYWTQYGYWEDDELIYKTYYRYDINPAKITVNFKDGKTITGDRYYIEEQTGFYPSCYSNQSYEEQWGVGSYTATIEFMGITADYTVTITETPIENIIVPSMSFAEGTNGYWETYSYYDENGYYHETEYYYYDIEPNEITVNYKDGSSITGTMSEIEEKTGYYFSLYFEQDSEHQLSVGKYTATLEFMGIETNYTVTITETPLESIVIEPIVVIKDFNGWYTNGYYDEYGNWQEGEWFQYETTPHFITLNYKDGTSKSFTYSSFYELNYDFILRSNQSYNNQWGVGANSVTFKALGIETTYNVEVIEEIKSDIYTYAVLSDGTAALLNIDSAETSLIIPDTIDGYTVTVLGQSACEYSNATSVTIPDSVRIIENNVFCGCYDLETVKLGSGVIAIGDYAFADCYSINKVIYYGSRDAADKIVYAYGNDCLTGAEWSYVTDCDGHIYDNDCDSECNNCYEEREVAHNFEWVIDYEGNCYEDGYKHEECVNCGEIRNADTIIPATGEHLNTERFNVEEATCGRWGYTGDLYCHDCGYYLEYGESIEPTGDHRNTDVVNSYDPTCTESGYTGDIYCYDCDSILALGEPILPSGKHGNIVIINDRNATCGEWGYTGDLYCEDCHTITEYGEEIEPTGKHTYDDNYDTDCNQCGEIREVNLTQPELSISGGEFYQGETIELDIRIDGNTGFAGLQLGVLYDKEYLTLTGITNHLDSFNLTSGNSLVWDSFENYSEDGVIATLIFKVNDNAPVGEYDIQLRFMSASNEDFQAVKMTTVSSVITVNSAVLGDASGDGAVDTVDLVMLRKYLATMDPETGISEVELKKGADANCDGVVDTVDLAFVRKYLASMTA